MLFLARLRQFVLIGAMLALAACQSAEERAEAHYRAALALLEDGDTVRATLEFRNVFDNNGQHLEARETFAAMLRAEGDLTQSYSQYLRLVEQAPSHIGARLALTEMALETRNWEEVRRHGEEVIELAAGTPDAVALALNLDYFDALEAEDEPARRDVFAAVQAQMETDPGNFFLQHLAIDSLLRDEEYPAALAITDMALADHPDRRQLHDMRLQILALLDDVDQIEAHLREMLAIFTEDRDLPGVLLQFYISRGEIAAAQEFLAAFAETTPETDLRRDARAALVQLLLSNQGAEAAIAETDRIIARSQDDALHFRALRASLRFEAGERDVGISDMRALLEEDLPAVERGSFQVALARMLLSEGDAEAARTLIASVLEVDPGNVEALKMQARWLIESDQTDRAIQNLRAALDSDAQDLEALNMMAMAYARTGDRTLSREFMSLAVQASGNAPAETSSYARVLMEDGRYLLAEEILIGSLRLNPGNIDLLRLLGQVYVQTADWDRAAHVERSLRDLEQPQATALADVLRAAILGGQEGTTEALAFLEALAAEGGDGDVAAQSALIRGRLAAGDVAGALSHAEDLAMRAPDNPVYATLLATLQSATGRFEQAEMGYRALANRDPQQMQAWLGLIRAQTAQGRDAEARAVLREALSHLPEAPDLLWAEAGFLEREGDIDGAIAIYERLYERLSGSVIVANNLASLLSTGRDDAESLDRAYLIARRLRGTDIPALQDTYGWIAHRRGQYEEALEYLEPAAAALSENALVQFHLGMTYLELGRADDAMEVLDRAIALAGADDTRPQFGTARAALAELRAGSPPSGQAEGAGEEDD